MNADDKEQELKLRELELREREHALRLRELEAEIYQQSTPADPPLYETRKDDKGKNSLERWMGKIVHIAKFVAFVVVGIVIIRIALWLSYLLIAGLIGFIGYKIFIEDKGSEKH